jgi:hypothetical protein
MFRPKLNRSNRRGTDPYARWCGRGDAVRRPPIPIIGAFASPRNIPARSADATIADLRTGRSALSAFHCRIEFTKLDASVRGRELPIGPDSGSIAPMLPGVDMALQRRPLAHPVRQIAAEGAQFDLGHIQPRAVLGRVVDFEPVGEALGFLGGERLVE